MRADFFDSRDDSIWSRNCKTSLELICTRANSRDVMKASRLWGQCAIHRLDKIPGCCPSAPASVGMNSGTLHCSTKLQELAGVRQWGRTEQSICVTHLHLARSFVCMSVALNLFLHAWDALSQMQLWCRHTALQLNQWQHQWQRWQKQ